MSRALLLLAMARDLRRAGLTRAERRAFRIAASRPGPDLTGTERALLLRYEAVASWGLPA